MLLKALADAGRAQELHPGRWIHEEAFSLAVDAVRDGFSGWFEDNPNRARMDVRDLRARVRLEPALVDRLVEHLAEEESCAASPAAPSHRRARRCSSIQPPRSVATGPRRPRGWTGPATRSRGPRELSRPSSWPGAGDAAAARGSGRRRPRGWRALPGGEAHAAIRAEVVANCARNGELSIPELRDAVGTTRKFLIPILEAFDTEGLTQRRGNTRVLRAR